MDIDEAHELYQQFQKVDAAAKQKQGLGFGVTAPQVQQSKPAATTEAWSAPYQLSDKFQQEQASPSKKQSRDSRGYDRPCKRARDEDSTSQRLERPSSKSESTLRRREISPGWDKSSSKYRAGSPAHRSSSYHGREKQRKARHDDEWHKSSQHNRHSASDSDYASLYQDSRRSTRHSQSSRHEEDSTGHPTTSKSSRQLEHGREDSKSHGSDRYPQTSRNHKPGRTRHDSDRHYESSRGNEARRRSDSDRHYDSSRRHRPSDNRMGDSSARHHSSDRQAERSCRTGSASKPGKADKPPDYSRLIVDYDDMTAAERLRAVTKYKLRKTSSKDQLADASKLASLQMLANCFALNYFLMKNIGWTNQLMMASYESEAVAEWPTTADRPSEEGKPWTRFVFNNDALLEEEGAKPDNFEAESGSHAGLGAFHFRPHTVAQKADTGKTAEQAHEAAIFGAPAAMSEQKPPPAAVQLDEEDAEAPQIVLEAELQFSAVPAASSQLPVADENRGALEGNQQDASRPPEAKLSWREKALLKKQQALQST